MHGCSTGSSVTPGHPHFKLHKRLAVSGSVSRACASTSVCRPSSSRISGVETQRQEKRSLTCSEDNVFGGCMGFDHDAGTVSPVSCMRRIHFKHPKEHQASPESYCSLPSEGSRSPGCCIHGDTLLHMRSFQLWLRVRGFHPRANPQKQIRVTRQGASYPFYVVQTPVSDFGSHSRSVLLSQDANDRRFPHGLGCGLGWPSSPRDLERSSS